MLINSLSIQGFRGLRDKVAFDLTAPITVILAPNGTGKTSICDSVEWLLSGRVERLKNVEGEVLRSKFSSTETFVEATLNTTDTKASSLSIKRDIKENSSVLSRKLDKVYKVVRDKEMLSVLVPDISITRKSESNMSSWLRATRFLESDSLNLLIDSNAESHDTRKLMFSSLFGIKDSLEKQQHLDAIRRSLGAEPTLRKEIQKAEQNVEKNKKEAELLKSESSLPHFEMANGYLTRISELLMISNLHFEVSLSQKNYETLNVNFLKLVEQQNLKVRALGYLNKNFEKFNGVKAENAVLVKKRIKVIESVEKYEAQASVLSADCLLKKEVLGIVELRLTHVNLLPKWLTDNRKEVLLLRDKIQKGAEEAKIDSFSTSALQKQIDAIEIRIEQQIGQINLIALCDRDVLTWLNYPSQIKSVQNEIDEFNKVVREKKPATSFDRQLSDLRIKLQSISRDREEKLQELNLIITTGHNHIKNSPSIDRCPLCDHQYDSNKDLLSIVQNKLKGISSQSKEETEIHAALKKIETHQRAYEKLLKQLSAKQDELKDLNIQLNRVNKDLARIGFEAVSPISMPGIATKIKYKLRDEGKRLSDFRKLNERLLELLNIAQRINSLLVDLRELIKNNSKDVKVEFLSIQNIDSWEKVLDNIRETAAESSLKIKEEIKIQTAAIVKQERQAKELSKQAHDAGKEVKQINIEIESSENFIRVFNENWDIISKLPVSGKVLKDSSVEINDTQRKQDEARKLFSEADKAVERALGLRENEKLADRLKKEAKVHEAEKKRIERVISYVKDLEKGISTLKHDREEFVRSQIEPLSETISSLYLRAQGNQVINDIKALTNPDGILDWIAVLSDNDDKLDNMVSLSQGQRQDLALAIFLGRARRLGGTFFLDEPLVHLDDLNRIALLDTIRVILTENNQDSLRLVITTSSNNLVRHLREKFSLISTTGKVPMRIYKLSGSPKTGNDVEIEELQPINNVALRSLFKKAV